MSNKTEKAERRGAVDTELDRYGDRIENHEERLSNLEKFKERAIGGGTILAIIAGTGLVGVLADVFVL